MNCFEKKIGIIGGGQLGKMMILEAKKMGFYVTVLDPTEKCPCHSICDEHIIAAFDDRGAIKLLSEKSDVVTYEFEHIDCKELLELEKNGFKIYPSAESLKIIQNKLTQKAVLKKGGIPVADFIKTEGIDGLYSAGEKFGYPFMLKTRTGGYDGKGNALVSDKNAVKNAFISLGGGKTELMAEKLVDFKKEISVLACRSLSGETKVYPVGENEHKDSILHKTTVPADISHTAAKRAMEIAEKTTEVLGGVGMFCVEMFVTKNDEILVNEVAPRPHNSGHYSIEACVTSQFENHIRAITGLPLGSTELLRPAVMINLLGCEGKSGKAVVEFDRAAIAKEGVKIHIYGKENSFPKRKMGHITVTADTKKTASDIADEVFSGIKITAE